jgi:ribosomal-protein-alanine N-acetyltransferase
MELRGTGATLRLPREDDAAALLALAADAEVTRWFSWGPYRSLGEPRAYLARLPAQRAAGEQLDLLVLDAAGAPAGIVGLSEFAARDRRAVIGTWLGREHWGTGLNAAAKAVALFLTFELLGLERVGAYANPQNGRSVVALERLGFVREGTLRSFHRHGTVRHDVAVFGLLRADWVPPAGGVELLGEVPPAFTPSGSRGPR